MADDKRDGDDLFEDLDKFFAPIKDVDWDEPASAGARETPSEEHVAVRAPDPAPLATGSRTPEPSEDEPTVLDEPAPVSASAEDDDDEEWYDTTVLDTIEGIGTDEPDEAPQLETTTEVVSLDDLQVSDAPIGEPAVDQAGLFASGDPADAEPGDGWSLVEDDEQPDVSGIIGTDTQPMSTIEEEVVVTAAPSDEELEAAADHFAPTADEPASALPEEEVIVGGVVGFEDDETPESYAGPAVGGDLLGELGADEVEQDILSDLQPEDEPQTVMVGAGGEGLGGPSWQEPTSVEVGADAERRGSPGGDRDVPAAFMTGAILAAIALVSLLIGKGVFGVIAGAVVLLAQGELYGVMVKHHRQPATAVGLVTGALMLAGAYFKGEGAVLAMFAMGVVATFLWFMSSPAATRKDTAVNIGLTILNLAWIPLLGSYLFIMLDAPNGTDLVVAVIALTFVYDTAAFLSGSVWGGQFFPRPLAPSVSPKKSIEGVIVGSLVTILVSVTLVSAFVDVFQDMRIETLLLGLVVAAAATFGDLAESLLKRDVGIKDMSGMLPGHGGVLDRIDSLLFVAPATFLFFRIIFT
ncbi:MAG: phosphatidate cytidylyltransferase [Acidimicrobiales bacterium]